MKVPRPATCRRTARGQRPSGPAAQGLHSPPGSPLPTLSLRPPVPASPRSTPCPQPLPVSDSAALGPRRSGTAQCASPGTGPCRQALCLQGRPRALFSRLEKLGAQVQLRPPSGGAAPPAPCRRGLGWSRSLRPAGGGRRAQGCSRPLRSGGPRRAARSCRRHAASSRAGSCARAERRAHAPARPRSRLHSPQRARGHATATRDSGLHSFGLRMRRLRKPF